MSSYTPGYARRRRARRRRPVRDAARRDPFDMSDGFDGAPAELPTARLRPGRSQRYRALRGDLLLWLAQRWAWLRPRTLPLIVATAGLFAVLRANEHMSALARGEHQPICWFSIEPTLWMPATLDPSSPASSARPYIVLEPAVIKICR